MTSGLQAQESKYPISDLSGQKNVGLIRLTSGFVRNCNILPITYKIKKIDCNFALIQQYITDDNRGPADYHFVYEDSYLANSSFSAISLTLPKTQQAMNSGITACKQSTIPATLKKATLNVAFLHLINSFAFN
jgi:hypothetical protein